jgi:hypothetical protein
LLLKKRDSRVLKSSTSHASVASEESDELEGDIAAVQLTSQTKEKIEKLGRFNEFLYHNKLFWPWIIRQVYGPTADYTSPMYQPARTKISENHRTWKSRTIKNMEVHVAAQIKKFPNLLNAPKDEVKGHFMQHFNSENFCTVWQYMANYIDVNESTPLGQYYMQGMYVNLAMLCFSTVQAEQKREIGVEHYRLRARNVGLHFWFF